MPAEPEPVGRQDGWIFAEDAALKLKLQGLTVEDANAPSSGRPVRVRYRLPETELADLEFPIIIIEHMGVTRAPERESRGFVQIPYAPTGYNAWWGEDDTVMDPHGGRLYSYMPIPYNLDYQVTILSRKANHLIPLVANMAKIDRLPARFGYIQVPQDGTVRTLEVIGGPDIGYGKDEDDKSLHRATYAVRVYTEFFEDDIYEFPDVQGLAFKLAAYSDANDIELSDIVRDGQTFGSYGSRKNTNWNTN